MPAGKYFFTISAQQAPDGDIFANGTGCYIEVRGQSLLQVQVGYTTDIHGDTPDVDPVAESSRTSCLKDAPAQNHFAAYISSATLDRLPILTHSIIYDLENSTMYNGVTYSQRGSCQYPWLSQDWACPNANTRQNAFTALVRNLCAQHLLAHWRGRVRQQLSAFDLRALLARQ